MIAVRLLSREELDKKLAPYRCRFIAQLSPHMQLWETGWGEPFTLYHEMQDRYAEQQYRQLLIFFAKTMPQEWNGGGGV